MSKDNSWKTLSSKIAYQNPWYKVREDQTIRPNGKKGLYAVVVSPPSVFAVALTEQQEIYLVSLYRYPTGLTNWEIPAGGSNNQDPLKAARRELQEETGLEASSWEQIGKFNPYNGISDETSYVFLATGLTQTQEHSQIEEGITEVKKVPFKIALEMIKSGQINDGQSISAITLAALYLKII